jgi:hypothetical protein
MRASALANAAVQLGRSATAALVPHAARAVERRRRVPAIRIGLGRRVAPALLRLDVQDRGTRRVAQQHERVEQGVEVVAVDGAVIGEPERGHIARDVAGPVQPAHVGRDRHAVVVPDDAHVGGEMARVVERLERHARRRGAVADHGDGSSPRAQARGGDGDAERRRDRRARVSGAEHVVGTLAAAQETGWPVGALDPAQRLAATRQRLVPVGLVPDVPHDAVVRGIEHGVQRDRELDGTEAAGEVSAHFGPERDQVLAQLARHLPELGTPQAAQRARLFDRR